VITFLSAGYRRIESGVQVLSTKAAKVVSEVVGKEMIMDANGSINVLLIGM
jgi:hypothetical protein